MGTETVVEEKAKEIESEFPLEYSVLALALKQAGAITYFRDNLPPEAMGINGKGHRQMYEAMLTFANTTRSDIVDEASFRTWLQSSDIYEALGGKYGVDQYFKDVKLAEGKDPKSVANTIKRAANFALQGYLSNKLSDAIESGDPDKIQHIVSQISRIAIDTDEYKLPSTGSDIAERADRLWELPDFLPTPFKSLNKALGYSEKAGMVKGAIYSILAASGKGKSTFAKTLMNHWMSKGHKVLFINYEEAQEIWERVLFTQITKQNVYKSEEVDMERRHKLTKKFVNQLKEWGDNFLVEHNMPSTFYEDMENYIKSVASRTGSPDVIIIDTLQSVYLKTQSGLPRWGQFEFMMTRLEILAKDLDCVILLTAQENNNRIKERREVVEQSDAGGSVAIVQKSSATIFITPSQLDIDDEAYEENIMQLQIPKNRITGTTFKMDPPLVRYNDDIKTYEPYEMAEDLTAYHNVVTEQRVEEVGSFA